MALRRVKGLLSLLLLTILLVKTTIAETKCLCQISGCLCCVELNLTTTIDLGGPVCVNVRQSERNVSLNLNYAENPVHNVTIALDDAAHKPTCMNLLSDLAQICAKFISMKTPVQGQTSYNGCLVIEPALLGTPQATYPVGCFTFDQGKVLRTEMSVTTIEQHQDVKPEIIHESDDENDDDDYQGLNAEELIAAVSASAEQGIALFSQWLGFNLTPKSNVTTIDGKTDLNDRYSVKTNTSMRRSRMFTLLAGTEDKNDERLKQLLSAQDNIVKESATIGEPTNGIATAFLYSKPDVEDENISHIEKAATISPENLAVVPSESRRGGRAYNINQHVNEI